MLDEPCKTAAVLDAFSSALVDPAHPVPPGIIGPDGQPAPKRFNVYRNNVMASLTEALEQTYPAVRTMLGEDYFRALAKVFIVEHPPRSPVLIWYGDEFPAFVEAFEPLRAYPYLGDLARLEWNWLEAYHAADAAPISPAALAAVPADHLMGLRLKVHPAARCVSSPWPVFSLFAANRFSEDGGVGLDLDLQEAQGALVSRPDLSVEVRLLRPGADVFLRALAEGVPLGMAAEAAASGSSFDLAATLGDVLSAGALQSVL